MSITRINVFSVKKDDEKAIKAFQQPRNYFMICKAIYDNGTLIEKIDCVNDCTISNKEVFVDLPKGRTIIGHIYRLDFLNEMPHEKSLLHFKRRLKDSIVFIAYETNRYIYSPISISNVDEKGFEWKAMNFPNRYSIKD